MEDQRLHQITQWARSFSGLSEGRISIASADASFRRYFRLTTDKQRFILMDAPPEKESTDTFVDVTRRLESCGLAVPHIHARNAEKGFLMLDDFGDRSLLAVLSPDNVNHWYSMALEQLIPLQSADVMGLPAYDHAMLIREMELFREWFLGQHLNVSLSDSDHQQLTTAFETLAANALQQPTAFVHRDYHSRNLMVVDHQRLGIIDYQDAVSGPVTYDAVSLLRDCYVAWPAEQVREFTLGFKQRLEDAGTLRECRDETFLRWFDLMGAQRHLKAIGIFARLNHRDGKPGYLGDIPRTLAYIIQAAEKHADIYALVDLLRKHGVIERLNT